MIRNKFPLLGIGRDAAANLQYGDIAIVPYLEIPQMRIGLRAIAFPIQHPTELSIRTEYEHLVQATDIYLTLLIHENAHQLIAAWQQTTVIGLQLHIMVFREHIFH